MLIILIMSCLIGTLIMSCLTGTLIMSSDDGVTINFITYDEKMTLTLDLILTLTVVNPTLILFTNLTVS